MNIVWLEHIFKEYALGEQRVQALKDISLSIENGAFLAIAGPSGSGKSTLLRIITGLEIPDSGTILFNHRDLKNIPSHLRDFGLRHIAILCRRQVKTESKPP